MYTAGYTRINKNVSKIYKIDDLLAKYIWKCFNRIYDQTFHDIHQIIFNKKYHQ